MKYGFFDESKKEYVITRPDTPAPWVNYLGSPEYGAIISNNAGGYSFAKSGANGRILRYIFNQFDQPGRYIYLRDQESKDYWSASWQPVGKDLNSYKSECHHGTAYTKMMADYSEIHSEVRYYVPLDQSYEVWNLAVTNTSDRMRKINVTGYAEFTNNSNYEQDQVNLQYSQFITRTVFRGNRVRQMIHANLDQLEDGKDVDDKIVVDRFFGLAGAKVDSWCGSITRPRLRTLESGESHTLFHAGGSFVMTNTNNGCACTPNQSIKCTVTNCAHHCQDQNYCGLNAITVGTHETNPTKVECTDCQSFQMK